MGIQCWSTVQVEHHVQILILFTAMTKKITTTIVTQKAKKNCCIESTLWFGEMFHLPGVFFPPFQVQKEVEYFRKPWFTKQTAHTLWSYGCLQRQTLWEKLWHWSVSSQPCKSLGVTGCNKTHMEKYILHNDLAEFS